MRRIESKIGNMYIHELKAWPQFSWDQEEISKLLIQIRHLQGLLTGSMESVGFRLKEEVILQSLTDEVVKSSEIEGEVLDQSSVRSSIAHHLGIDAAAINHADRSVDGIVEMMLDATQRFDHPLTKQRLFSWHASLFPTGWSGITKIRVGAWRKGPVQVVSGRLDRETIHFEGPSADRVDQEMEEFLNWLSREAGVDGVLKAAIAHLWFVTIHPFDDGNGRIGRAIADLLLARSENSSHRFYSLSAQIQKERKDYYQILERSQKSSLDITPWLIWFLECLTRAIEKALLGFETVRKKEEIWKALANIPLNARQQKLINRILDGFEGKLTSSKWAKIAKCSQDTAHRDIADLINKRILIKNPEGGRSTNYSLNDQVQSYRS